MCAERSIESFNRLCSNTTQQHLRKQPSPMKRQLVDPFDNAPLLPGQTLLTEMDSMKRRRKRPSINEQLKSVDKMENQQFQSWWQQQQQQPGTSKASTCEPDLIQLTDEDIEALEGPLDDAEDVLTNSSNLGAMNVDIVPTDQQHVNIHNLVKTAKMNPAYDLQVYKNFRRVIHGTKTNVGIGELFLQLLLNEITNHSFESEWLSCNIGSKSYGLRQTGPKCYECRLGGFGYRIYTEPYSETWQISAWPECDEQQ